IFRAGLRTTQGAHSRIALNPSVAINNRHDCPAFSALPQLPQSLPAAPQGAVRSVEHAYDPRIANVGDPWRRRFNYPMLWITIGKALNFTNERWFIAICVALVLCFIGLCAILIFLYSSFGLLASLASTSTLLGMERGNIDLVVFCLLFCATLWIP